MPQRRLTRYQKSKAIVAAHPPFAAAARVVSDLRIAACAAADLLADPARTTPADRARLAAHIRALAGDAHLIDLCLIAAHLGADDSAPRERPAPKPRRRRAARSRKKS